MKRSQHPRPDAIALLTTAALLLAACGAGAAAPRAAAPADAAPTAQPGVATVVPSALPATAAPSAAAAAGAASLAPAAIAAATATTSPATAAVIAPAPTGSAPTSAPTPQATAAPATAKPIAPSGVPGPVTTVAVTLTDISIKLGQAAVPAGTVTFSVSNKGSVVHDLVVLKTDQPQNQLPNDPTAPAEVQEPGFMGKVQMIGPGATGTLALGLGPGSYVLICNQPAHYLIGMHTSFTVK